MVDILIAFCTIGLILSIYFLIRNNSTHSILKDATREWRKTTSNHNKFKEVEKVIMRYTYNNILYSLRPIRSFQKEIMSDIKKIINSKNDASLGDSE